MKTLIKRLSRLEDFVVAFFVFWIVSLIIIGYLQIMIDHDSDDQIRDLKAEFSQYKDLTESNINALETDVYMLRTQINELEQYIQDMNYVTNEDLSLMVEEKVNEYNQDREH